MVEKKRHQKRQNFNLRAFVRRHFFHFSKKDSRISALCHITATYLKTAESPPQNERRSFLSSRKRAKKARQTPAFTPQGWGRAHPCGRGRQLETNF